MADLFDEKYPEYARIIQVSAEASPIAIQLCLSKLVVAIEKLAGYHASEMWLHDYGSGGGAVNLSLSYWLFEKSDLKLINKNLETYAALDPEHAFSSKIMGSGALGMIKVLPLKSTSQCKLNLQIKCLIAQIETLKPKRILDLTLHDLEDENSVPKPLIRVYYLS